MNNMKKLIKSTEKAHDPRRQWGNLRYKLSDILVIAFCAILCGAQTYDDLELFGRARREWLSWFLDLRHLPPSADTFARIFKLIDYILKSEELYGKIVSFDRKTIRGSGHDGQRAFQVLTAFLVDSQIVIGEEIIDEKSNEIQAIPELLEQINVKETTVTIDAIGTQAKIAEKIVEKEADYVLALKRNHPDLYEDVKLYFDNEEIAQNKVTKSKTGSRQEVREYFLETNIDWLHKREKWVGLAAIGSVCATVEEKGKKRQETRYFITSLRDIEQFARAVRGHWGIENGLHWHLDVTFGEDASRVRDQNAVAMWNVLRKTALEYLKQVDPGKKVSRKSRRRLAGWDKAYLQRLRALE